MSLFNLLNNTSGGVAPWDWSPYLVGGAAARPDSMPMLDPEFSANLQRMYQGAPPDVRENLKITSAYRSPETQKMLWDKALKKYGSPEKARRWVAPPGSSQHNVGRAVDFKYGNDAAKAWAHENAGRFGLHFPMSWEPWQIELMGSRGGKSAPSQLSAQIGTDETKGGLLGKLLDFDIDDEQMEKMALLDMMAAEPAPQAPPPPQRRQAPEGTFQRRETPVNAALLDLLLRGA